MLNTLSFEDDEAMGFRAFFYIFTYRDIACCATIRVVDARYNINSAS